MYDVDEQVAKARRKVGSKLDVFEDEFREAIRAQNKLENNPIKDIEGVYDFDDFSLKISTEPVDVLMKSVGQVWEQESCERLDPSADCRHGPFGDIEKGAGVVFFYRPGSESPYARTMVRWCDSDKGRRDVGIEPKVYPLPERGVRDFDVDPMMEALIGTVKEHGFADYEKCRTPYRVKGFSHMGQTEWIKHGKEDAYYPQNKDITYIPWWKKGTYHP